MADISLSSSIKGEGFKSRDNILTELLFCVAKSDYTGLKQNRCFALG